MPYRIAGLDSSAANDPTAVNARSAFADCIVDLFRQVRPMRIIETGTYLGTGTTAIIAAALRHWQIAGAQFLTIEVNPAHHAAAAYNLQQMGLRGVATLLTGLSVPRRLLPAPDEIRNDLVEHEVDGIFVDHVPAERVQRYAAETDFPAAEDDLLGKSLKFFDHRPDFLLLDSAGHMGHVEFSYVVPQLRGRCFLALDDTNHVKHYRSLQQMKADARFRILAESAEKFGFCFAEFNP